MKKRAAIIILHLLFWGLLILLPTLLLKPMHHPGLPPAGIRHFDWLFNLGLILFFYLNYFFFIPRFLRQQRMLEYAGILVGCFMCWLGILAIEHTDTFRPPQPVAVDIPPHPHDHGAQLELSRILTFWVIWMASLGARYMVDYQRSEQKLEATENARLRAELTQLKSQLNPHFLFNTLNGIQVLVLEKSDNANTAIMHLGDLLRYVIADANAEFVPLQKDLNHLDNFIALQQMRFGELLQADLRISGTTDGWYIAPLLFIPFVENAFKYGIGTSDSATITITFHIAANGLIDFTCTNQIFNRPEEHLPGTGIGIANTQRRLALHYPDTHNLDITRTDSTFRVALQIPATAVQAKKV